MSEITDKSSEPELTSRGLPGYHPPFIQITTTDAHYIYGLTRKGDVWRFSPIDEKWEPLTDFDYSVDL